jgi:hypothetical protein
MNRRDIGWALMAAGIVCILFYILISLRGLSPTSMRVGGTLFYVGIVGIAVGAVLRWSAKVRI